MLLISESDVKKALTIEDVIGTVEGAFRDYSEGLIDVPPQGHPACA